MTWPNTLPNSAAFDSDADSIAASRPELKKMSDAVNTLASNVYTAGSTTGTITPDVANGEIQSITLTGNITMNAFANPVAGQRLTMIFKQPAAGSTYDLTSNMLWENGLESLTQINSAVDTAEIFYDGTDYYARMNVAHGSVEVYDFSNNPLTEDLDVNNFKIVNNVTNGNVVLQPNGTGDVHVNADTLRVGDSNANATITTNGTGDLTLNTNSGTNSGFILIQDGTSGIIRIAANGGDPLVVAPRIDLEPSTGHITLFPNPTAGGELRLSTGTGGGEVLIKGVKWPTSAGSAGQFLKLTSSTETSWSDFNTLTSNLNLNGNDILSTVGAAYQYTSLSVEQLDLYTTNGLFVLRKMSSDDPVIITTGNTSNPDSAGGDLNHDLCLQTTGSNTVGGTSGTSVGYILLESGNNNNIRIVPHGTGAIVCNDKVLRQVEFKDYAETVYNQGNVTGSFSITVANGNTQRMRLTGNVTFTGFVDAREGQTVTLIITQDGTGNRTFTEGLDSAGRMLFAGGVDTLSTAGNATDIMTISYIAGTYYASINKGYV